MFGVAKFDEIGISNGVLFPSIACMHACACYILTDKQCSCRGFGHFQCGKNWMTDRLHFWTDIPCPACLYPELSQVCFTSHFSTVLFSAACMTSSCTSGTEVTL